MYVYFNMYIYEVGLGTIHARREVRTVIWVDAVLRRTLSCPSMPQRLAWEPVVFHIMY